MHKFKLEFINARGESIELYGRPFRLISVIGLGEVEGEVQMQRAPFQDGASYIDSALQPRYLEIELKIYGQDNLDTEIKRRRLTSMFNPRLGEGTLRYIGDSGIREINVVASSLPHYPDGLENRTATYQRALVYLVAPDPHWKDETEENHKLEDFVGSFRFPFTLPTRFSVRGDSKVLANNGDVTTPIEVEFRGPVTNPKITNQSTGEFIRINRAIPIGYKLLLNTSFGNKRVEIVAPDGTVTNAFHYVDLQSTFFDLDIGDNRISFDSESGNPEVYIRYKHRYLSV